MSRRKVSSEENRTIRGKVGAPCGSTDRDKKILNSVINTSIILMSTMMGGLSEAMVSAAGAMVSGMAGAVGGREAGEKVSEEFKQKLPEINEEMRKMISDLRKEVDAQLRQKIEEIKPLLSNPTYDIGPKTIEKYDFKLPKLTEELDESTLAQYIQLLISEDPRFTKMFKELVNWMNTLPDSSEKTAEEETKFEASYPLPDDVRNFSKPLKGDQINFQTSLSLKRIVTFYRRAFAKRGLTEIKQLTNITEESISLVFSSADDDKVVVLQSVDLAYGTNMDLRNVNLRTEKNNMGKTSEIGRDHVTEAVQARTLPKKHTKPRKYEVYVDDNFHYMDENERYKLGEFESCEEAVAVCKKIVDDFLEKGYTKGMSFKELYEGYLEFGEDPFIVSGDRTCFFSAWDYAKERCRELCGEEE